MRRGYVSVEAAAALYGVIIDGKTFVVDEKATAEKRAAMGRTTQRA